MATRRDVMTGAATLAAAAILPVPVFPLTEAQLFARDYLRRRIRETARQAALIEAMPQPTPGDEWVLMMERRARGEYVQKLAAFDRQEGTYWHTSTRGRL